MTRTLSPKAEKNTTRFAGVLAQAYPLTLVFLLLKLTHTVTWDWMWVLSPAWIAAGLSLSSAVLLACAAMLTAVMKE